MDPAIPLFLIQDVEAGRLRNMVAGFLGWGIATELSAVGGQNGGFEVARWDCA